MRALDTVYEILIVKNTNGRPNEIPRGTRNGGIICARKRKLRCHVIRGHARVVPWDHAALALQTCDYRVEAYPNGQSRGCHSLYATEGSRPVAALGVP